MKKVNGRSQSLFCKRKPVRRRPENKMNPHRQRQLAARRRKIQASEYKKAAMAKRRESAEA